MTVNSVMHTVALPAASEVQRASGPLLTLQGDMALNLRETGTGGLAADTLPTECGRCRYRPVFADTRQGVTNILTLADDGTLYREVSLGADGTRLESAVALGRVAPGDCRLARAGDFVAVCDGLGTLSYLYWEDSAGTYRWLGAVPEMPPFSVDIGDVRPVSGEVEAVAFDETVPDMRAGVPAAVRKAVGAAVESAVKALHDRAAGLGLYTAPVLVRLAVRLWDGSLLHLSEPVLLSAGEPQQPGRVAVPLAVATAGMTGTLKAPLTLDAFSVKVTADTAALGGWRGIVRGIEVWVTPPQRIMDEGGTPEVSYNGGGGTHALYVRPAFVSGEAQARTLFTASWRCVAVLPLAGGAAQTVWPAYSGDGDTVADYGALRRRGVTGASAMTGHGGFLHLGAGRRLLPLPALPRGEYGATEKASCRVAVKFAGGEGARTVAAGGEVTCDGGRLLPVFSYPDPAATALTVQLAYADGRLYERTFPLSPAATGEGRAVWIPPSPGGIALPEVAELSDLREGSRMVEESGGTVVTMARGNPFVPYCETAGAAGSIVHIEAQRSGGGAYTRQYLYLFSDTGISALTHTMTGEHTNCRPVSGRVVTDRRRVCSCDEGVFAVCDDGSLVRLRDSRVQPLLRGTGTASRLLCSQQEGEIWLLREGLGEADVIAAEPTPRGCLPVRRSGFIPGDILEDRGRALYVREAGEGWTLLCHAPGEAPMVAQWQSPVLEYGAGGMTRLRLRMEGEADAEIRLDLLPPDVPAGGTGVELLTAQIRGSVAEDVTVPLMLPDPRHFPRIGKNRLRLRLRGNPGTLLSVGFDSVEP